MKAWFWLIAAIGCEVSATLSLKGALEHPGWYAVVAAGYLMSFLCLSRTLTAGMALGVAYGIWGALGVAATALGSALLFDESLTAVMIGGIVGVVAGVLVVELGAQRAATELPR